ncbi:MAG: hypothetical protein ACRD0B_00495 [Acidimicrobiales bacterium]
MTARRGTTSGSALVNIYVAHPRTCYADEHDRQALRGRHPGLFAVEAAPSQGALW